MFANTYSNIGWTLAIVIIVGAVVGLFINARQARPEVGSEIELAPNRKRYYEDEELETHKLDRTLFLGLLFLGFIAVALPLYWLYEPARQEGAIKSYDETFVERGQKIYEVGAQCVSCHGPAGVGGAKDYAILNDKGEFVAQVKWQAPALNNVFFRYSYEEVKFILNYGRGNSPMPAWGAPGGGPLTEQQLDNVMAYLYSIQLPAADANAALLKEVEDVCKPERDANGKFKDVNPKCTVTDAKSPGGTQSWNTLGEALFNLGYYDAFSGGSYSCGRCHTKGWSYGKAESTGGGFLGPNLTGGSELRQFETFDAQVNYVTVGSVAGQKYGRGGLSGAGQMPGFGANPNLSPTIRQGPQFPKMQADQVMLPQEMIEAVVAFERGL